MRSHWYENDVNILFQMKLILTRRVLASFLQWGFLELVNDLFAICTSPIIHLVSPLPLGIAIVPGEIEHSANIVFFLGGGGQTSCIMGDGEMENYDKLNQEAFKKNQERKKTGTFFETLSKLWIKWWQFLHRVFADRKTLERTRKSCLKLLFRLI